MYDQLVRFLLLCEGSSDRALVSHLQKLLSHCGAAEVVGTAIALTNIRDPGVGGGSVLERKMRSVLFTESEFDLLFVHRDADAAGYRERFEEIVEALEGAASQAGGVCVVPVRTTEAWILLDEDAIRRVAGNPSGRGPLGLPRPSSVEDVHDPKEALRTALVEACGHQGHRLRKFRKKFGQHRRILLEQLPVGGALNEVPAWVRLRLSVSEFLSG